MSKIKCVAGGVLALLLVATGAVAQQFPSKAVTVVLPAGPGGVAEMFMSAIAPEVSKRLGQPVVADHRPGAGGLLGIEVGLRAVPDGHTLIFANDSMLGTPNFVKTKFDPEKDLAPIAIYSRAPHVLVVNGKLGVTSLKAFVDYAKANPGKLNAAVLPNTIPYLQTLRFMQLSGMKAQSIPYPANPPVITALLADTVDFTLTSSISTYIEHIKTGRLRVLAVGSAEPFATFPDVPTFRQAGYDFESVAWQGIFAPAAVPQAAVARLSAEIIAAAQMPSVVEKIRAQGFEPWLLHGDPLKEVIARAIRNGRETARQAGIQPQ